jgi:TPR repeat protein
VTALVAALILDYAQDGIRGEPAGVAALYADACRAGATLACQAETWRGLSLSDASARVFTAGCTGGDGAACLAAGWSASQIDGRVDPAAPGIAGAAELFKQACGLGVERGCVDLGTLYQFGAGMPVPAPDLAVGMYRRGCDAGEMSGCRRLGAMYHLGIAVGRDAVRARELYEKACDGGLAEGCNGVGLLAELPGGGAPGAPAGDPAAAEGRYRQACDMGLPAGCGNLARLLEKAGAAGDVVLPLYQRGCNGDVAGSCLFYGGYLLAHAGDPAETAHALGRACDLALPAACLELGIRLLRGEGVPVDPAAGADRLESACRSHVSDACVTLAVAADEGHFIDKDETRATWAFGAACEEGLGDACRIAADRLRKGIGGEPDPTRASELYFQGCNLGDAKACQRAK